MDEDQEVIQKSKIEEVYSLEELRANCKILFGIETEIFDGVFYDCKESLSKEGAKEKIDKWLGKKVE